MPVLTPPVERVQQSFLAAMAEFHTEGRGDPQDETMIGREIRLHAATWHTTEGFAHYVTDLRAQALPETPRPSGFVPSTTLWWVEGDDYLGRIAIRHGLTPHLLEAGGHIGYDVRPTARRRGHATAMLRAALPLARDLGIDSALVTCDKDNTASRRVIEANDGVLEDERAGMLRFWVPTSGRRGRSYGAFPIMFGVLRSTRVAGWRPPRAAARLIATGVLPRVSATPRGPGSRSSFRRRWRRTGRPARNPATARRAGPVR